MHVKVYHVGKMEETWLSSSRLGIMQDIAKLREPAEFLLPSEVSQHSLLSQKYGENGLWCFRMWLLSHCCFLVKVQAEGYIDRKLPYSLVLLLLYVIGLLDLVKIQWAEMVGSIPIQHLNFFFCYCFCSSFFCLFVLFFYFFLIFTLFCFTILYWFCHTLTWIHHGCTCIPDQKAFSFIFEDFIAVLYF